MTKEEFIREAKKRLLTDAEIREDIEWHELSGEPYEDIIKTIAEPLEY